jgi:hypothetical protein
VFLVSHGHGERMSSVADSCPSQADWPEISQQIVQDWRSILEAFQARGIDPHLLIIPSKKTLYAEHLPKSVPRALRSRCLRMRDRGNPIAHLALVHAQSVIDAYPVLLPFRNRPHFYPPENFHADGESAMRTVSAAILDMGYPEPPRGDRDQFQPVPAVDDLGGVRGFPLQIRLSEPVDFDKTKLAQNADFRAFIAAKFGTGVYARRYQNADAPHKRSVLLISNSFGNRVAPYFASAYETVDLINTNQLKSIEAHMQLFEEVVFLKSHEEVVFILQDEALFNERLKRYSEALTRL